MTNDTATLRGDVSGRMNGSAYYAPNRYDSAVMALCDSPSVRDERYGLTRKAGPLLSGSIKTRDDCDCAYCRTERGLEALSTAELTAKREAKQGRR